MSRTPSAAAVIKALRQATSAEKSQILEALGATSGAAGTAGRVAADIDALRSVLEVISEQEATFLLADTGHTVWGVNEKELVSKLEPFLDAHWEVLQQDLGRIALICGVVGKRVLGATERRVVRARNQRGAQSIASLIILMEQATAEGQQAGLSEGEVLERVSSLYQELVADYGQQLGLAPGADAICGWEVNDLILLKQCKMWMKRNQSKVYWGDWMRLNQALYGLFMKCKRSGLPPGVNERQVRFDRAKNPNVLYQGLRKGEAMKWGGYLEDVNGQADQGQRVWGGGKDAEEMANALTHWAEERAKAKGIDLAERGAGWRLLL